ncbi:MAG: flagellar biosynthetic protein FliO [Actinobacteria bacterium]|nr:flagellar biosynthetic protein FliO [Actinomycetota bacterium]MBV8561991.1 flagellar biosynthetic protein FliO [Actinomycetota bacterium]
MALACLAILVPGPGTALAASSPRHHAAPPAVPADTTPLPQQVVDAGAHGGKTSTTSTSPSSGGSGAGSLIRLFGGLVIVLGVIYGIYWLLKAYGKSKRGDGAADERLSVLGTTVLAPNRSLHLVRVGQEVLLVGSAEQSVTPIRAYSIDELRRLGVDVDELELQSRGRRGGGTGASSGMLESLKRMTAR